MTDEDQAIDRFFEDEEQVAERDAITGEPVTEEPIEKSIEEPPVASTPPVEKEPTLVPIAALHDERRKAQQLREENESLRSKIPKSEEAPDPYDDLEAHDAFIESRVREKIRKENEAIRSGKIDASRTKMLETHNDFLEMEKIFGIMTAEDSTLIDKILDHNDPVGLAYSMAKKYKEDLLGNNTTKTSTPSQAQLRNQSAVEAPNLATATAQASNATVKVKETDIEDVFADVGY